MDFVALIDLRGHSVEHAGMRRSFSPFPPITSMLALSTFAILFSCGGSSASSADKATPSSANKDPDEKSLFLVGAQALEAPDCIAKSDMSTKLLSQGVLDLAFTSSYAATLLVGNQLAQSGSATETERVALSGAEVTLTTEDGTVLKDYTTVGTGFVDAAAGSAAYGLMGVSVIPAALLATEPVQSAQLLVAKIRVFGEALNGTKLTSSELDLPIKVCTGCLVQYPPSADDPAQPAGAGYHCATSDTGADAPQTPCFVGQDVPFSCVICAASVAMCSDPMLNPTYFPK